MKYDIYTDGACYDNPGKGGYGIVIVNPDTDCVVNMIANNSDFTTHNRMELQAVLTALKYYTKGDIIFYSDSSYVTNMINSNQIDRWKERGFVGVSNSELWIQLMDQISTHEGHIQFVKIPAKDENDYHKLVDKLSKSAMNAVIT